MIIPCGNAALFVQAIVGKRKKSHSPVREEGDFYDISCNTLFTHGENGFIFRAS